MLDQIKDERTASSGKSNVKEFDINSLIYYKKKVTTERGRTNIESKCNMCDRTENLFSHQFDQEAQF